MEDGIIFNLNTKKNFFWLLTGLQYLVLFSKVIISVSQVKLRKIQVKSGKHGKNETS
jgi:hypothetical protein